MRARQAGSDSGLRLPYPNLGPVPVDFRRLFGYSKRNGLSKLAV